MQTNTPERIFDVLVVGAGPAGSASAYYLARQGRAVCLVDRSDFPRDKRCGDAIMPPALDELQHLGIAERMHQRFSAVHLVQTAQSGLLFPAVPIERDAPVKALVAPRKHFDDLLRLHAMEAGAEWLSGITVHALETDHPDYARVVGVDRLHQSVQLRARIVIAADGAGSRLARQLRQRVADGPGKEALTKPDSDETRFTALRGYYQGMSGGRDTLEFFFGEGEGTHYFWIFPVDDEVVNVGVIAYHDQLRRTPTDLKTVLELFLSRPHIADRARGKTLIGNVGAAPILVGMRGTALYGDHLLIVGDAAALVDPASAEGISGALTSGRLAAETALRALARGGVTHKAFREYGDALRQRYEPLYEQRIRSSQGALTKNGSRG